MGDIFAGLPATASSLRTVVILPQPRQDFFHPFPLGGTGSRPLTDWKKEANSSSGESREERAFSEPSRVTAPPPSSGGAHLHMEEIGIQQAQPLRGVQPRFPRQHRPDVVLPPRRILPSRLQQPGELAADAAELPPGASPESAGCPPPPFRPRSPGDSFFR